MFLAQQGAAEHIPHEQSVYLVRASLLQRRRNRVIRDVAHRQIPVLADWNLSNPDNRYFAHICLSAKTSEESHSVGRAAPISHSLQARVASPSRPLSWPNPSSISYRSAPGSCQNLSRPRAESPPALQIERDIGHPPFPGRIIGRHPAIPARARAAGTPAMSFENGKTQAPR